MHAPWGSWAASQKPAYPPGLCSHIASLVLPSAVRSGKVAGPETGSSFFAHRSELARERAAQGLFPRGSQMPPLVDPFPRKVWRQVPSDCDRSVFVPGKRLPDSKEFPKGSTALAVGHDSGSWWAQVGIPVTPEEFLVLSSRSQHPESMGPVLPPILRHSVHSYCSMTSSELSEVRVNRLKSMLARAEELRAQEHAVHLRLEPRARDVLKGKRLLLFGELLAAMNFPDTTLTSDIQQGFRITGWLQGTRVRPTKVIVPSLTADDVWTPRHNHNRQMWSMCRSSGDDSLDQALWTQTLKECESGWATLHVGLTQPPSNSVLSKRFAVQQHDKVRPIDDFSVSQVLAIALQRGLTAERQLRHSGEVVTLSGKTFDLKSAYKQLPIHSRDLRFAQATVWNPQAKRPAVISLKALPFGATGSVHGFCRCSIAI